MLREIYLKCCVKVDLAATEFIEKKLAPRLEKRARTIDRVGKAISLSGLGLMLVADTAMAASGSGGIGSWTKEFVQNTGVPVLETFMWGGYAVGAGMFASGISKFTAISRQQTNATPKEAFGYTGGGGALMGLGYLADRATESFTNGGGFSSNVKSL